MADVVYVSRARMEERKGPDRRAWLSVHRGTVRPGVRSRRVERPRESPHGRRRGRATLAHLALAAVATIVASAACAGAPGDADRTTADLERLPDGTSRGSQPAVVRQRMGAVEIAVVHNRPTARGRELFGGLVAYDEVWNPGADEATRIELNRDVLVNGRRLPAGRYSVWAVPRPDEWTLIFSRAYDVFHMPYPEGEDALRLDVPSREGPWMESLAFYFPAATRDSAELVLHWGTTVVPLTLRHADM